jgi:ribosome biogenesis GTPase
MSPKRTPEERQMKRFLRDIAALERDRKAAERPATESGDGRPLIAQSADADAPDDAYDVVPRRERHRSRRSEVTKRRAESLVGDTDHATDAEEGVLPGEATVVATTRGPCEVELPDLVRAEAHLPKALARAYSSEIAVGDRVRLSRRPSGELVVARLLPRTSRLSRPDPFDPRRERVLAANLDLAVVVGSVRRPPLSTGLLDRFLVALRHGDVAAVIAINKIDLAATEEDRRELLDQLAPYVQAGISVVPCSSKSGEGLDELRRRIAGRLVAFVGHSGVGKSSLLNALAPQAAAVVGAVTAGVGRGRHTTTASRIYRLADGTRIVDTPGVREFGLWSLSPRELAAYFDEFEEPSRSCRFADCTHRHEPHCGVRAAVADGRVAAERLATYLRILESLERP